MLSIVATMALGMAVGSTSLVISQQPTAVISIPSDDATMGGGFSMNLPTSFTHRQAELLAMSYDVAKQDGHKYPQLLQGILLQETHAGELASYKVAGQEFGLKANERYYGIFQVKLSAAREVLSKYPTLIEEYQFQSTTDEEIIAKLIENDHFSIAVASKYILILKSYGYDTMKQLAIAYNQGPAGARGKNAEVNKYSLGVMAHIQSLRFKDKV